MSPVLDGRFLTTGPPGKSGMCVFKYFLTFWHYKMIQFHKMYRFLDLVLKSAISIRSSGSFYWRMILETKIWVLGRIIDAGVLLL